MLPHWRPMQRGLLLQLLLVAIGPGRASISHVYQLPSESFQLATPQWLFAGHGFVSGSDAVYRTESAATLCDCMTHCFVDVRCVSLSYDAAGGDCRLNNVRGHPATTQHQDGILHRIRPRMAVLGDWCQTAADCELLTSNRTRCKDNTCRCPPGEQPASDTECVAAPQSTTATPTVPETSSATTSAPGQTSSTGPTVELTTVLTTTSDSTTNPAATPEPTTTPAPSTAPATTPGPTPTPQPTSTPAPSTAPATTPESTTTPEPTTTPQLTTASTSPPVASAMEAIGDPVKVAGSTGSALYTWVCGSHQSGTSILVGMTAGGGKINHFDAKQCADFSTLPGFLLKHSDLQHLILAEGGGCPANSVVIAIQDAASNANSAIEALCAPVAGGYVVDCSQPQTLNFAKNVPIACDQYYAVTGLAKNEPWTSMTCCKVVPAK